MSSGAGRDPGRETEVRPRAEARDSVRARRCPGGPEDARWDHTLPVETAVGLPPSPGGGRVAGHPPKLLHPPNLCSRIRPNRGSQRHSGRV